MRGDFWSLGFSGSVEFNHPACVVIERVLFFLCEWMNIAYLFSDSSWRVIGKVSYTEI